LRELKSINEALDRNKGFCEKRNGVLQEYNLKVIYLKSFNTWNYIKITMG
jgi:hypothetical protein